MNMKKYMDIERLKPTFVDGFEVGDKVVLQEKIDGANFSIRYDEESNSIKAFSRNKELDCQNTLRGAWNFSQTLDVEKVKEVLSTRYVFFGEWLVHHTVKYPDDKYNKAYFYDVYDTVEERYMPYEFAISCSMKLGLTFVPVLYVGDFVSWEHVKEFVGTTRMGGKYGEGVVVKNQTKLNNPNTRLPFYTKIVCDEFCETKAHRDSKPVDMNKVAERQALQEKVETIVTSARVKKLVNKMVDEGILPEDWCEKDMGTIAKNIGKAVYYDCQKEEPDVVNEIGEMFGKLANSTAMRFVRDILKEKQEV